MKTATLPVLLCAVMLLSISEGLRQRWLCPRGWAPIAGRCFKYIPAPLTWAQAERTCLFKGGNLVSVRSPGEYRAIQRFILAVTRRAGNAWIGGSDSAEEHVWLWSDGKPMKYTNWCPHQPDNARKNEHCLEMNYSGRKCWNDLPCALRRPFICARKRKFWIRVRG